MTYWTSRGVCWLVLVKTPVPMLPSAVTYIGDLRDDVVLRPTDSYMYAETYYSCSNRICQLTDHQPARSIN